jgi:Domain of unknown function (DUF4268)
MSSLGRLEPVDPRSVWPNEAANFTPWLLANAERLAEALGIELELDAAEHGVGGYSLDLIGRDLSNGAVLIVENQLATTDHTHLGQVLTYAAGTAASTIVWIATAFREEHRQALDWLNENTGEDTHFFGIELQVVRIGDSASAPLFNLVVQPNDWQKQVRAATQPGAATGRGALYVEFWSHLFERLKAEHPDWRRWMTPRPQNWTDLTSSIKGTWFSFAFAQPDRLKSEFNIDTGDDQNNLEILSSLRSRREEIERAYGRPLSWEDLPNRRTCRIADYKGDCNVAETERFDEYTDWFFDTGMRFRQTLPNIAAVSGLELKARVPAET